MTVKWSFFVLALAFVAALIIFIVFSRGRSVRMPGDRPLAGIDPASRIASALETTP